MLMKDPGPGISASLVEGSMNTLEAQIIGPEGSPYEDGVFMLSLTITDRYYVAILLFRIIKCLSIDIPLSLPEFDLLHQSIIPILTVMEEFVSIL